MTHMATLVTVGLISLLLASCGSVQRAYWDAKVEEMCRKDAGVTVYERVTITPDDYKRLGGVRGTIAVPPRPVAKVDALYVADTTTTEINENPTVLRFETQIVRTSDGRVLSRQIDYGRVGGEVFRSYGCRDFGMRLDVEDQTFEVAGGRNG